MLIGIFADTHDHLANIRLAVERFNAAKCELVLFAGDLVSTFAVPPLRRLNCPFVGCFGDNEGNKVDLKHHDSASQRKAQDFEAAHSQRRAAARPASTWAKTLR